MHATTHTCLRWQSVILSLMASWSGRYLLWSRCCQLWVSSKSPISADGGTEREGEFVIYVVREKWGEMGKWVTGDEKRGINTYARVLRKIRMDYYYLFCSFQSCISSISI